MRKVSVSEFGNIRESYYFKAKTVILNGIWKTMIYVLWWANYFISRRNAIIQINLKLNMWLIAPKGATTVN